MKELPTNPTIQLCRDRGWVRGTRLRGAEYKIVSVIELLYVGEQVLIAREIERDGKPYDGRESTWTLDAREWEEIPLLHHPLPNPMPPFQRAPDPAAQAVADATLDLLAAHPAHQAWIQWPGQTMRFMFDRETDEHRLFVEGPLICFALPKHPSGRTPDYVYTCHYRKFSPVIGYIAKDDPGKTA